ILAQTITLETGAISRFPTVGHYASYCRCVDSTKLSNGKRKGTGNVKNGNPYLACAYIPTVSPVLAPVTSRNLLSLQSLTNSVPYRQDNVRRRKDAYRVGTAARGSRERLSRLPRRLPSDGGSSGRVRRALSTRAGDSSRPTQCAPLPPGPAVSLARQKC